MKKRSSLPPHQIAEYDQDHARLQDLTRVARRHARYCPRPHMCPGAGVEAFLELTECGERDRLLLLAIAELAGRGYGQDRPRVDVGGRHG